jgi:hypothetical protein
VRKGAGRRGKGREEEAGKEKRKGKKLERKTRHSNFVSATTNFIVFLSDSNYQTSESKLKGKAR